MGCPAIMRVDRIDAITVVQAGFIHLNLLSGYLGAANPADQFLGLTAEHAATDDFNTSPVVSHVIGLLLCL
jgi:hypothetical protein